MIDTIQGPPRWDGPDVLLRQTSFRALAEPRRFRTESGEVVDGSLRVRFGEVEARGVALTEAGRDRYDELIGRDAAAWAERCRRPSSACCATGSRTSRSRRPGVASRARGIARRAGVRRRARRDADRLRGLPAAFGGRHLPVEPDRRRLARRRGRRHPPRRRLAGRRDRRARCAIRTRSMPRSSRRPSTRLPAEIRAALR